MSEKRMIIIGRSRQATLLYLTLLLLLVSTSINATPANAQVTVRIIGEDPNEGFNDLDIIGVYCGNNTTYLAVNITAATTITNVSNTDKYWGIQIDADLDSANNGTWDYEYVAVIRLDGNGVLTAALYNSSYSYIEDLVAFGGNGTTYVGVYIPLSSIGGPTTEYYLLLYTQSNSSELDHAPLNDTSTAEPLGDYYICHLVNKNPTWTITLQDPLGDVSAPELDIVWLNSTLNNSGLYLGFTINGTIPWYGGGNTAIYEFFIDADNNTLTGYSIGGIGADYLVEMTAGYIPRLYEYSGNGTSWSWTLISLIDYLNTPGGTHILSVYVPESKANFSKEVTVLGYTTRSLDWVYDTTSPEVVPIPEPIFTPMLVILVAIIAYYLLRRWKKEK